MNKKSKLSMRARYVILAVSFCAGVPLSYLLFDAELRKINWLYALVAVAAVAFDVVFFKMLISIMRHKKVMSKLFGKVGRALKILGKKIGAVASKTIGSLFSKNKTFISGTMERRFVIETRESAEKRRHKKLPKLQKDATEREKIRYRYASYVFERERDIDATLTPSEVGDHLDPAGNDKEIFESYNGARYAE